MQHGKLVSKIKQIIHYISAPFLTVITSFIGVLSWFAFRSTVDLVLRQRTDARYASSAIHNFSFLLYGVGLLVFIIICKYYYDEGRNQGRLLQRFAIISFVQALLFLVIFVIRLIIL